MSSPARSRKCPGRTRCARSWPRGPASEMSSRSTEFFEHGGKTMSDHTRVPVRATDAPPPAGPYSQAIRSGGFLFLAGQGPFRPDVSKVESSFEDQARQAFKNLQAVAAAGRPTAAGPGQGGGLPPDRSHPAPQEQASAAVP